MVKLMSLDAREVHAVLKKIRKEGRLNPVDAHTSAIAYLKEQIPLADAEEDQAYLYHCIAEQHSLYRYVDEEEMVLVDIMGLFPKAPMTWISASGFYLNERSDVERAIELAKTAVQVAEEVGHFVVHANNTLCRAAKQAKNYALMEEAIMRLLNYKHSTGSMDSAYECDFLIGLPEAAISEILVRKLRALCKR